MGSFVGEFTFPCLLHHHQDTLCDRNILCVIGWNNRDDEALA